MKIDFVKNNKEKRVINKDFIIKKIQEIIENDETGLLNLKQQKNIDKKIEDFNNKIIDLMKLNKKANNRINNTRQELIDIKSKNDDKMENIKKQLSIY